MYFLSVFSYKLPNLLFPFIPLFSILFSIPSTELSPWSLCIKHR